MLGVPVAAVPVAPGVMDGSSTASPKTDTPSVPSTSADIKPANATRPLYSSKLSDQLKGRGSATASGQNTSSSPVTISADRKPTPPQRAWTGGKNPITQRPTPNSTLTSQGKQSVTGTLREGQRVRFTLTNGSEYEGTYESNPADSASCYLKMVQQTKGQNGTAVRNAVRAEGNMSFQRNHIVDARPISNNTNNSFVKANEKAYNGNAQTFRTDTAISGSARPAERPLQRFVFDADLEGDMSLEAPGNQRGTWDQFAVAEQRGLTTDYDENIYTTRINRDDPDYKRRAELAERKAREIENSVAMTSHVAEERRTDYKPAGNADDQGDEEERYSGVRRQEFPPLQSREMKYTPPARRAPTGQSTVKGAPVDPAIISSQLKAPSPKVEETKTPNAPVQTKAADTKEDAKPSVQPEAATDSKVDATANATLRAAVMGTATTSGHEKDEKNGTVSRPSATAASKTFANKTVASKPVPSGPAAPAVPTTNKNLIDKLGEDFKDFAMQEHRRVENNNRMRLKVDKESKLNELRNFSASFKLDTPVPDDIITIIAKDPQKQKEIMEKASRDMQELAASKAAQTQKDKVVNHLPARRKQQQQQQQQTSKTQTSAEPVTAAATGPAAATASSTATAAPVDTRAATRPTAPHHSSSPSGVPTRQPVGRPSYAAQAQYPHQSFRNGHQGQHMGGRNGHPSGNLAQRIRDNKFHASYNQHMPGQHLPTEMRAPPTGPANNVDPTYGRRLSGLPPSQLPPPKLNPSTQEFRPNAWAPAFNPAGPSQSSSPRSLVNNVVEPPVAQPPAGGKLIRRKTKAVDPTKCNILGHLKTLKPKVPNKNWDDNGGLQPCYATNPVWRQIEDENKEREQNPNSTMLMTYQEYFEKLPMNTAVPLSALNAQQTVPTTAHLHQLPLHLQNPNTGLPPGQSPRIPTMPMHTPQPAHLMHAPYPPAPDDHRMMHSNSAQSFSSPRVAPQMPMAYAPAMNATPQMPYAQPLLQPYMANGAPQMNPQFRTFSGNPQFLPPQGQHMGGPAQPPFMMAQPAPYVPNGIVPGPGPMPMYPGAPQYMQPPVAGPPPSVAGSNGYPSPNPRPAAPMMAHQGSYQGQQQMGFGMSPGVQYQQAFVPQQHQNKYNGQR